MRMSSTQNLAKNTLYLTLASIGQKIIAFVYFMMIARLMGVENTGAYSTALAVTLTFAVIGDMGVTSLAIREVSKKTSDAKLWIQTLIGFKILFLPLAVIAAIIAPYVFGHDEIIITLVRIAVVVMVIDGFSQGFYGVLRGLQNLKYESIGIFVGQAMIAALGFFFLFSGTATLELLIVALIAGSSWNLIYSGSRIVKIFGWSALKPSFEQGSKPLKIAFAFFLAGVFMKVMTYSDTMMISNMLGNEMVGFYTAANKLTNAFRFIPLAFVAALFPTMSAQAHDPNKLKKTLLQSEWYMALIGMPIVFGIWSLAPELILAVYDEEYLFAILPLQILIFLLIPIFLEFPFGSLLNATNRQNTKTSILAVTTVLSLVLNFSLIPVIGVVGSSIAAVISFSVVFILSFYFAKKVVEISVWELMREIGGLFISALVMAVVVILLKPHMHFVMTIPLGAVVYIASAFALKAITFEHVKSIARILKRKKTYVSEDFTSNA